MKLMIWLILTALLQEFYISLAATDLRVDVRCGESQNGIKSLQINVTYDRNDIGNCDLYWKCDTTPDELGQSCYNNLYWEFSVGDVDTKSCNVHIAAFNLNSFRWMNLVQRCSYNDDTEVELQSSAQNVTLTCSHNTEDESAVYRWTGNDFPSNVIGVDTKNLTITSVTTEDTGPYYCEVINNIGTSISHYFLQYNVSAPQNTSIHHPYNSVLDQIKDLVLKCSAIGYNVAYNWSTTSGSLSNNVTGRNTSTLRIPNPDSSDNTTYICTAYNDEETDTANVTVISTYVTKSSDVFLSINLTCDRNDTEQLIVVEIDTELNGTCGVYLYCDDHELIFEDCTDNKTFMISGADVASCMATVRIHEQSDFQYWFVHQRCSYNDDTEVELLSDTETVTLTCSHNTVDESAVYRWTGNDFPSNVIGVDTENLTITSVTTEDTGPYYCEVTNNFGTSISHYFLQYNVSAPRSTSISDLSRLELFEDLVLKCSASGYNVSYIWTTTSGSLPNKVIWRNNDTLRIPSFDSTDNDTYICTAYNEGGNDTAMYTPSPGSTMSDSNNPLSAVLTPVLVVSLIGCILVMVIFIYMLRTFYSSKITIAANFDAESLFSLKSFKSERMSLFDELEPTINYPVSIEFKDVSNEEMLKTVHSDCKVNQFDDVMIEDVLEALNNGAMGDNSQQFKSVSSNSGHYWSNSTHSLNTINSTEGCTTSLLSNNMSDLQSQNTSSSATFLAYVPEQTFQEPQLKEIGGGYVDITNQVEGNHTTLFVCKNNTTTPTPNYVSDKPQSLQLAENSNGLLNTETTVRSTNYVSDNLVVVSSTTHNLCTVHESLQVINNGEIFIDESLLADGAHQNDERSEHDQLENDFNQSKNDELNVFDGGYVSHYIAQDSL